MNRSPCRVSDSFLGGWGLSTAVLLLGAILSARVAAIEHHTAHGGPVKGLTLSPDGRWLVSTSFDYSAVLWSIPDLTERRRLIGHEAAVNSAAFSPDGRYLVTAGDDRSLRVWRVDELLDPAIEPIARVLEGHTAKVVDLAFSADGRWLASSSWDHSIGLWSVPAFDRHASLRAHDGPVNAARFSGDGRTLYSTGADGHVRQWDVAAAKYVRSPVENGWGINVLAIDETQDLLAYGTANGRMCSTSLNGDGPTTDYVAEGTPVLALTLDSRTRRLAFGDSEGRILVIDTRSGEVERDFRAVMGPVWGLALMPGRSAIVIAGLDDFITRIPLQDFELPGLSDRGRERRFHPLQDLDNGARQFARKCSVCHSLEADSQRRAGPTLHRVFGRKAGGVADYPYSNALAEAPIVWTAETIDALFREGPDIVTPGSKMPLQRIENARDREDLIDFLKTAAGDEAAVP